MTHEHDADAWNRHRARHQPKVQKIYGRSLAHHAKAILSDELTRIKTAIDTGLSAGDSNTDLAHRVIGSRQYGGINGMTEITRQHIIRLGRGYVRKKLGRNGPEK